MRVVKLMLPVIVVAVPGATACGGMAASRHDGPGGGLDASTDAIAQGVKDASSDDAPTGDDGDDGSDGASLASCGEPCTTAGRCLARLAVGQSYPGDILVNTTSLYWQASDTGVMRMALTGGVPTAVVGGWPGAVDAMNLYYVAGGDVDFMPLAGGAVTTLAAALDGPAQVLVDSAHAYVLLHPPGTDLGSGGVVKIPFDGGTTSTISDLGLRMALDANSLYVTAYAPSGTSSGFDRIIKIPLDGSPLVTLASTPRHPGDGPYETYDIAVGATHVYWLDPGVVRSVPIGGGEVREIASGLAGPRNLALDDEDVYWTDAVDGTVNKAPLDGGPRTVLASCQKWPTSIAVDGTSVYWTNWTDPPAPSGVVMKLTPK